MPSNIETAIDSLTARYIDDLGELAQQYKLAPTVMASLITIRVCSDIAEAFTNWWNEGND